MSEKAKIPEVIVPRPNKLRAERRIFAVVTAAPVLFGLFAIVWAIHRGIHGYEVWLFIGMSLLSILGIEVGYHRLFSHRAFKTVVPIRVFLAICGAIAGQGPLSYWVAHHRRHHKFSDYGGDPHSPIVSPGGQIYKGRLEGLWHAHYGWIFQTERANPGYYARDILEDRWLLLVDRLYLIWLLLGLALPALLGGLLSKSPIGGALLGLLWGGFVRLLLVQQGTYSINSLCHTFGGRPFVTGDSSTNLGILSLISLGGSWHNNHHAFPSTAINAMHWWQIDLGGGFIMALRVLRLAWDVKHPTPEQVERKRRAQHLAKTTEEISDVSEENS